MFDKTPDNINHPPRTKLRKPKVYRHTPPPSNDPRCRYLPLTHDKNTLVPNDVFDWLDQTNWSARTSARDKTFYAGRPRQKADGPGPCEIKLHNEIWQRLVGPIPHNVTVDHINKNGLDNSLANLRLATPSQQRLNITRRTDNTSGFTGVHWSKKSRKWYGQVQRNKEIVFQQLFDDKISAAWARDAYCREHCPRATLNNPPERRNQQLAFAVERRAKPHLYVAV